MVSWNTPARLDRSKGVVVELGNTLTFAYDFKPRARAVCVESKPLTTSFTIDVFANYDPRLITFIDVKLTGIY